MKPNSIELKIVKSLKAERLSAGYKIINVANSIGVSESTISKIEGGKLGLTIDRLYDICDFLKIPVEEFLSKHNLKDPPK